MIRINLGTLQPTPRLLDDQAALAAVTDGGGPECVEVRGSAGYTSLRPQMWQAQYGKCGYCEDYLREVANEVDHIRPKAANKYWWLAFALRNLVLACRTCNNFKRNKWELQPGVAPLVPRQEPWVTTEPAMLVDPTWEDPEPHLGYEYIGGKWRVVALSERGRRTIAILRLDRMSFTREANEWIRDAIDPRVRLLRQAAEAGDQAAAQHVIAELLQFTAPGQRWSQLAGAVVAAVRGGTYS